MTPAQRETVDMILGTLSSYEAYRNEAGNDVLLLDPAEPLSIIAVNVDGTTHEFRNGEWETGWEA